MSKTVAYQGISGSFSALSAEAMFGSGFRALELKSFRPVVEAVINGTADYGVLPIENAIAGSVHENYDLLIRYPVFITAEYCCPIQMALMAGPGVKFENITHVYSHYKAIEQCSAFFEKHTDMLPIAYGDTAGAAKFVSEQNDKTVAAIAGEGTAKLYGLNILAKGIQNHSDNMTRFVAISAAMTEAPDADKASISFLLPHQPGSLSGLLTKIFQAGWNLTKIESRPVIGRPFEYRFIAEVATQPGITRNKISEALAGVADDLRVLGVYKTEKTERRA